MQIVRKIHKVNAALPPVNSSNYLANRIGFWGLVIDQNSLNNTVTVVSDTGYELKNIPVFSSEWVTVDNNKNYIPSTRNLPPKNSRVFVLTPTFTAVGAFVLCSGFSRGDENIRTLWAADNNELQDKNNSRETKTQGGWDITEEYANGNYSVKSNDEKIVFTANTTQDDNKSQVKEVSLSAWDNIITVNEDGISITDKNDNKIEATSDGLKVTDAKENVIEGNNNGISITDKNKKKIILSSSGVVIKDDNTDVINYNSSATPKKVTILGHLEVSA